MSSRPLGAVGASLAQSLDQARDNGPTDRDNARNNLRNNLRKGNSIGMRLLTVFGEMSEIEIVVRFGRDL